MTLHGATLHWLGVLILLVLAVGLTVMAVRGPRQQPDPAVWRETLVQVRERHRHRAPAKRLCVIERTEPNLRLAEVNAHIVTDRPGRHEAEFINQPTCVLPDFPRLIREGKL